MFGVTDADEFVQEFLFRLDVRVDRPGLLTEGVGDVAHGDSVIAALAKENQRSGEQAQAGTGEFGALGEQPAQLGRLLH
jgi:hypothetical protein